jgi:WD40 repeat protein
VRRIHLILVVALAGCGSAAPHAIDAHNARKLVVMPSASPKLNPRATYRITTGADVVVQLPAPNGKWLVRAAAGKPVELRDARSGGVLDALSVVTAPVSLAWSADSTTFAVGDMRGRVSAWNEFTHHTFDLVGPHSPVTALAISPDKRLVATAQTDRSLRIWDTGSRKQVAKLRLPGVPITLRFSADGRALSAASLSRAWQLTLPR